MISAMGNGSEKLPWPRGTRIAPVKLSEGEIFTGNVIFGVNGAEPPQRFSATAVEVLRQRYLRRDGTGALIETADGMFERVAAAIAQPAERYGEDVSYWQARFYQRLRRLEFLPNSPTVRGICFAIFSGGKAEHVQGGHV
ncbi:MAG: ribonucleotide reductase N-terminal alpha domain-containing protein [Candidatus Binatia bacterium]